MSRGGAFRVFLSELAAVGLDLAAVCGAARVDPRILHDGVPLGLDELTRILERAEAMARDVSLGLHMAERARGRGVLSYVARTQRTVGDGLRAFESFAGSSWGSGAGVRVEHRGATAFVESGLGRELLRHAAEYVVARTAISLRRSGGPALEVRFRHLAAVPPRNTSACSAARCGSGSTRPGYWLAATTSRARCARRIRRRPRPGWRGRAGRPPNPGRPWQSAWRRRSRAPSRAASVPTGEPWHGLSACAANPALAASQPSSAGCAARWTGAHAAEGSGCAGRRWICRR